MSRLLGKCRKRKTMYEDKYRKGKIMWSWKLGKLKREKLTRENAREWPIKVLLNGKIKKTTYKEKCKQRRPKEKFIKAKNQENNSQGKRQKKKASSRAGESPNIQSQHRTCLVGKGKFTFAFRLFRFSLTLLRICLVRKGKFAIKLSKFTFSLQSSHISGEERQIYVWVI